MSHSSKTKLSDPTQASENGQRLNTGPSMTGEQPPYNMFEMISHTFQLVTSIHQKLDAQAKDFTSLYNDVHKSGGIEDRLQSAISEVDDQTTQIAQITKENENLRKDMEFREVRWTGEMGGLVCRGWDWGSPRAAQRILAVPLGSAVVFTPNASVFPPPKYGWVTGIH